MTAACTRPWARAAGICGNGIAIWWMDAGSMPACLARISTASEFSEVSWTSATFLPARSFTDVMPEPLAATRTVESSAGFDGSLPSTLDTHLTLTPLELRLISTGVVMKPNCSVPLAMDASTATGLAWATKVTFRPCCLKMPLLCA